MGAGTGTTAAKPDAKPKARGSKSASAKGVTKAPLKIKPFVALVAREVAGQIVSYRTLHRR
jgi:hypothetical protein